MIGVLDTVFQVLVYMISVFLTGDEFDAVIQVHTVQVDQY